MDYANSFDLDAMAKKGGFLIEQLLKVDPIILAHKGYNPYSLKEWPKRIPGVYWIRNIRDGQQYQDIAQYCYHPEKGFWLWYFIGRDTNYFITDKEVHEVGPMIELPEAWK